MPEKHRTLSFWIRCLQGPC